MPFERSLSISIQKIVNIVITRNVFKLCTLVYTAYSVVPLCMYIYSVVDLPYSNKVFISIEVKWAVPDTDGT